MTAFPALAEAEGKLKHRQDELGRIFKEAGETIDLTKVTGIENVEGEGKSKAVADHIKSLNDEMAELGAEIDALKAVARAADDTKARMERGEQTPDETPQAPVNGKSIGRQLAEAGLSKLKSEAGLDLKDVTLKTLMTTSAGWAPETTRTGTLVDFATRPIQILDLIPTTTTNQAAVKYMEETTFTNSAAEVAEGGTYAESALALTERVSVVQKIGTFLPITDEEFEDVDRMEGYVNNRLPFMVRQRLDSQVVNGNGTTPNLRGMLNVAGIQTQAKGTDPVPDAVYKALVLVRVTGRAMPNVFLVHPTDWQDVRLLRTADGVYIWGSPSEAGPERIWGVQVAKSDALIVNTGIVTDTSYLELAVKRGVNVQVSNSHSTFFIEGKQALRADMRAAFVAYRPAAICTVTGI